MKTTTNHGLKKPDGTDIVNIEDLNYNADTIDGLLVPATTTVNGLMSKTDKVKLDGVAAGANNYTHPATHPASMISGLHAVAKSGSYNDLLNKPSTFPPATHKHTKSEITDFPSSLPANGGNADTLDGKHASAFAPAGFGLGTTCVNVTDWNNITSNGYYMGSNASNAPTTDWWFGYTIVHNANWVVQVVNNFNTTRQWKQRFKSNGVWTAWEDFGGGGAKSVQRGVVTTVSGDSTLDITISPVNINKASANLPFTAGIASSSGGDCYIGLQLINSTTLRLHYTTTRSVSDITWEVIEYK